ncbi:O-acetylserine/cysteine efflux transporter [Chromohalobacter marismortui]|uniref:O-acetylserine/cysteine efflux transporter n=1 Tax=Chromohalobacter marismortui TaxID=42055 RepID=A0A4V3F3Z4_9GAMM|nr:MULTISPECIES: EamA family transporter [Chromohalobacter]MCI0510159.1 EamA family transporter [Chromohalobacter sp.]MCI0592487.1 EamA family transporter [Chromohalobacter sp.]TDU21576.1 O-acetylserine/cysteine efflux transporter [Chromohalobacter marismortui]
MPLRDLLIGLLVIVIWAFNIIVIKVGVDDLPPLMLMTLRFTLVAALVVPFTRVTRRQLPWLLVLSVTFGGLHFPLLFLGLQQAEAGTGALLVQMGTPFATLLAALFLKERLDARRLLGLLLAFAGAVVLAGGPALPNATATLTLLCSALAWAVSTLIIKRAPAISPLTLAGWIALFAIPQVALGSWLFETQHLQALRHAGWIGWGAVFYTAVMSSIIAYGLWYALLRRHPINRVVPLTLLMPVIAVFLGVWLLGDALDGHKLLGGALVIAGLAVINLPGRRQPRDAS